MNWLKQGASDLMELFFPGLCIACGNRLLTQENYVCVGCWADLPATNFHNSKANKVAQLFWGRVDITHATAYFSYKKGSKYQNLIHSTKYKGVKELGFETGLRFGHVLNQSEDFSEVGLIVPVPLHKKKLKQRGYNQSYFIAKGIAKSMAKPLVSGNLFRRSHTSTQTRKNRYERWQNVEGIFGIIHPEEFENRHILLIDDVVTTGSTLEACAHQLLQLPQTKVSIATLAFADI